MKRFLLLLPVILTLSLMAWTGMVYPFSKYDSWHIYPALSMAPLVVLGHAALIITRPPRGIQVLYAGVHLVTFYFVWMGCLMLISKDSF